MSFLKETHILKNQGYDTDEDEATRDDEAIAREVQGEADAEFAASHMTSTTCSNQATLDDIMKQVKQSTQGMDLSNLSNIKASSKSTKPAAGKTEDFDAQNFNNSSVTKEFERSLLASISNVAIEMKTESTRSGTTEYTHAREGAKVDNVTEEASNGKSQTQIDADEEYARRLQDQEDKCDRIRQGLTKAEKPSVMVPDGYGGVQILYPSGCGNCQDCVDSLAKKVERLAARQEERERQRAEGGSDGGGDMDAYGGHHGDGREPDYRGQHVDRHARGGDRHGAHGGAPRGPFKIKIYAQPPPRPKQPQPAKEPPAPQAPQGHPFQNGGAGAPRDRQQLPVAPRDQPRGAAVAPRGGGGVGGAGGAPQHGAKGAHRGGGAGAYGARGGAAVPGRGGGGVRGRRPVRMLFVMPPRREIDRRGLLNEGSRVERGFSAEEWARIQRNPLALPDVMADRDRARMRGAGVDDDDYEALLELSDRLGEVKRRGLEELDIARMPTVVYADDRNENTTEIEDQNKCKICLERFQKGDRLRTLPCLHKFHKACIDKWIKKNGVCPICRIPIKEALDGESTA